MKKYLLAGELLFLFSIIASSQKVKINLIDKNATQETKALYFNLKKLSENHILFGHQHATEYGQGWVENETDQM